MTTFVSRIAARVSRMVRGLVRFVRHPIWCYSPSSIARAVQRDWDGPVNTAAREILGEMHKRGTLGIDCEFSEAGEIFLVLECRVTIPNTRPDAPGEKDGHESKA